jgi:hypothetical protein
MGYSSETIIQEDSVPASKAEILWENKYIGPCPKRDTSISF